MWGVEVVFGLVGIGGRSYVVGLLILVKVVIIIVEYFLVLVVV